MLIKLLFFNFCVTCIYHNVTFMLYVEKYFIISLLMFMKDHLMSLYQLSGRVHHNFKIIFIKC